MKCHKCMQPAVVHLTEILSEGPIKKALEMHLCYQHGLEAGLISPGSAVPLVPGHASLKKKKPQPMAEAEEAADTGLPTAIVPAPQSPPGGLVVAKRDPADAGTCPVCGNTWAAFKQSGMMGCPHDYAHFEAKILPLVKRAQEGAVQHAGKVPQKIRQTDVTKEVTSSRLRRELQKAIDDERYEEAARLRDQLRKMETN